MKRLARNCEGLGRYPRMLWVCDGLDRRGRLSRSIAGIDQRQVNSPAGLFARKDVRFMSGESGGATAEVSYIHSDWTVAKVTPCCQRRRPYEFSSEEFSK